MPSMRTPSTYKSPLSTPASNPTPQVNSTPYTPATTARPSNNSATSTTTPSLATPAAKNYVNSISQGKYGNIQSIGGGTVYSDPRDNPNYNPVDQPQTQANTQTPQVPTQPKEKPKEPESPMSAYLKYQTGMFDDKTVTNARKQYEESQKRLADIQNEAEERSLAARREQEKIYRTPGGTKTGASQSAEAARRQSSSELADIAVREGAAARSALVAENVYNNYINAGKSVYEAEQAANKAATDETRYNQELELKKKELEFQTGKPLVVGENSTLIDPTTGQVLYQGQSAGSGGDSNELLSVTEAQLLGVPYGTTKGQAMGAAVSGKPTAEQSKARQFAVSAENANQVLNSGGYNIGKVELPLPNLAKGENRQKFEQAARAFVNATLRRESGATITDDEFKNKYKELIDQPGDSAGVKTQKKSARSAAVQSIQEAGGNAQTTQPNQTQVSNNGITPSGIKYTIED
jgi:hypothetical protein